MQLIFGHDEALSKWASARIPYQRGDFGQCRAIGVASGTDVDAHFYATVVYHNYITNSDGYRTCEVSIAAISAKWALRGIIRALLSVPFEQYGVSKLYSLMMSENKRAIRFNKGIGFKQEAILRHHFGKNRHAVVTSMLDKEYQRIYGDGKILTGKRETRIVKFPTCKVPEMASL